MIRKNDLYNRNNNDMPSLGNLPAERQTASHDDHFLVSFQT